MERGRKNGDIEGLSLLRFVVHYELLCCILSSFEGQKTTERRRKGRPDFQKIIGRPESESWESSCQWGSKAPGPSLPHPLGFQTFLVDSGRFSGVGCIDLRLRCPTGSFQSTEPRDAGEEQIPPPNSPPSVRRVEPSSCPFLVFFRDKSLCDPLDSAEAFLSSLTESEASSGSEEEAAATAEAAES